MTEVSPSPQPARDRPLAPPYRPGNAQTLTDWLLARLAEDEAAAEGRARRGRASRIAAMDAEATGNWRGQVWDRGDYGRDCMADSPDSLADRTVLHCAAARRIIRMHLRMPVDAYGNADGYPDWCSACDLRTPWPCPTLRALTIPYSDHRKYNQEWRMGNA